MAETRPSGRPLVPDAEALVSQEIAEVDGRGRIHILPRWTKRTIWPPFSPSADFEVLLVLKEPGRLRMIPWEPVGPQILARFRALEEMEDGPDLEALRLLQDRYVRMAIPRERRPYLGSAALQHLGLPTRRGSPTNVYVVVMRERIDIIGPAYRDRRQQEGHPALDDLP